MFPKKNKNIKKSTGQTNFRSSDFISPEIMAKLGSSKHRKLAFLMTCDQTYLPVLVETTIIITKKKSYKVTLIVIEKYRNKLTHKYCR